MLALREQASAADALKADHAAYARMALLAEQLALLRKQAVKVASESRKAAAWETCASARATSALSCDVAVTTQLATLGLADVDGPTVAAVAADPRGSAKLSLLAEQVEMLREQAEAAVAGAALNATLREIAAAVASRLVPGTVYHLYTQRGGVRALSRVAPHECSTAFYDVHHGGFLYDFDFSFKRLGGEEEAFYYAAVPAEQAPQCEPYTAAARARARGR